MAFEQSKFSIILFALDKMMNRLAKKYPSFAKRLKEKNLIAQIKLRDNSQGRHFIFQDGRVSSKVGRTLR